MEERPISFQALFCPPSWATGLCEDLIKQNKGESRYSTSLFSTMEGNRILPDICHRSVKQKISNTTFRYLQSDLFFRFEDYLLEKTQVTRPISPLMMIAETGLRRNVYRRLDSLDQRTDRSVPPTTLTPLPLTLSRLDTVWLVSRVSTVPQTFPTTTPRENIRALSPSPVRASPSRYVLMGTVCMSVCLSVLHKRLASHRSAPRRLAYFGLWRSSLTPRLIDQALQVCTRGIACPKLIYMRLGSTNIKKTCLPKAGRLVTLHMRQLIEKQIKPPGPHPI
ncbi:hypothetical protein J6590_004214 [Homalodisca vitripennis]|nr:hypothetical protein J6590_004214 [Homalodisca vitripennis]